MKSFATVDFWEAYAKLPAEVKEQARKAYQLWNPTRSILPYISKRWERTFGLRESVVTIER